MAYNFNFNLDLDQAIIIPKAFWTSLGTWIANTIRAEAQQGIFQTDEPYKKDYNVDYARLKERRFTYKTKNRYVINEGGMEYAGQGKERVKIKNGRKGQRLKQFEGVSISSTNTSFVDMTATGQTLRSLKILEVTNNGVTLTFNPRDIWKIIGNQKPGLNRRLVGLRRKNREKVRDMIVEKIQDQLIKKIVGKTTINIKL